jgi:hypothetical protein
MDDLSLESTLNELVKEFMTPSTGNHAKQAQENCKKLENSTSCLQENLDYLRVCIKYQTFDLEATRRENDYLRKLSGDVNNKP